MSAFDDIADDDLRAPHAMASSPRVEPGLDIQDKCDELLRLAHDIPLDAQPAPHFVTLLQHIWSDDKGREQLLSSGTAAAEHLVDVAQRVRGRAVDRTNTS
jgi:hypothetical protein